jgi:hypothetical protein
MSTLGKVLAVLNVLAAIGLFTVAALNYGQRQAWTTAVFQQDLLISGLPINETQVDVEGKPIVSQLGKGILQKLFSGAGEPVRTQLAEVKQRHDRLAQSIDSKEAMQAVLLPLARSVSDREELRDQIAKGSLEDLKGPEGPFEAAFKEAMTGKDIQGKPFDLSGWKQAIAHVLYGTSQNPQDQQRTLIVVGLDEYVHSADKQAARLAQMVPELQLQIANGSTDWQLKHKALIQEIVALAERVRTEEEVLTKQQDLRDQRHQALVAARKGDVEELTKLLENTRKQLAQELTRQSALETQLVDKQKEVAAADAGNQQLEREIRSRESAH